MHVGYDDLFPYRIEYWRTETDEKGTSSEKLMLVMEWYEVRIGAPIEAARFAFQPPVKVDRGSSAAADRSHAGMARPTRPARSAAGRSDAALRSRL